MRIKDLFSLKSIDLNVNVRSKDEALDKAIDLIVKSGNIKDIATYRAGVYEREMEGTTAIGDGIAIPHCKSRAVIKPCLAAMLVKGGVEFNSPDGEKADLIFLIAAPETGENIHLDVLSKLSVLLLDEDFTKKLRKAKSPKEFLQIIDEAETKKDRENFSQEFVIADKFILAVTGCPTGIAHTYMAAEALEKAAREKGCRIKVETRGSGGAKNILNSDEIAIADCIIVAADTQVPMDRFDGKLVIQCRVAEGISKAEELIDRASKGNALIYRSGKKPEIVGDSSEESVGHGIYKNIMNGVSHMLPFVVGGGLLIAIAFLVDGFSVDINALSMEERGSFGSITPAAGLFKRIGDVAFGFMLPILAGFIAMGIADRPGLAVGFVGGAIAAHGTSGFLGALIAGFAAGYLVLFIRYVFGSLPEMLEGLMPVLIYPLIGILLIGLIMLFVVEPPVGALNQWINSGLKRLNGASALLLGALLGGMMSADMGGPINKAAYVFGTASIASGSYNLMAAVMVGGMVPPIAIALSTLIFKNKYSEEERKAGPMNFILGLSFITEGAIPFAASDPVRVLPSCIVGSAIAGALSMLFGCTFMAPHGGIFVFPTVGKPWLYLLALAIGSVVAGLLLGILKRNVE